MLCGALTMRFRADHSYLSLLRVAIFTVVLSVTSWSLPAHAIPIDCSRLLTEAAILTRHIEENTEELSRMFAQQHEQTRNWIAFLNGSIGEGQRVHIVQQTRIKQLNESLWNISGTEEYLEAFHDILHRFLSVNPAFGKILHNDYKNHFVSSVLSEAEFQQLVLTPVMTRLATRMVALKADIPWETWIPETIFHGVGGTPAEAYFSAGLKRATFLGGVDAPKSFSDWQRGAIARRRRLTTLAEKFGIDWPTLLNLIHKNINHGLRNEHRLLNWLKQFGKETESMMPTIRLFYDDLQMADFQPLPDTSALPESFDEFLAGKDANPFIGRRNWTVERRAFFAMTRDASNVVVSDVQNLGGIARRFQDRWIANGAKIEELPEVYAETTRALESFLGKIYSDLKLILGENAQVRLYWSGDDVIWFLPEVTDEQRHLVKEAFGQAAEFGGTDPESKISLRLYNSAIIGIGRDASRSEAVAHALMSARTALFALKKEIKKKIPAMPFITSTPSFGRGRRR